MPDFQMGMAFYLEGDHEKGRALIAKAVDAGHRMYHWGFFQSLRDEPGFAPIFAAYEAVQKRERHKVLTVVCNDNPYAEVWQPEEGTCKQFLSEQGNQSP